jgi:Concanavalin A-like lectin/glucanases superfamily
MTRRRLASIALFALAFLLGTAATPAGAQAATYAQTVGATPGLAAYWRLGEAPGATTAADAVGAWPGTYAAATLGATGALSGDGDSAARFTGAGSISAGNGPALAGPMTVEAWTSADTARTAYLVSDGTSSSTGYHLWLSRGAPVFTVRMTGGTVQVQGPAIGTLAWHHLAATVDATNVTLYVDGAPVATKPALGTPRASGSTLTLGRYSGGGRYHVGGLDEVALYAAALDPATVAAHWALGADTRPPETTLAGGPAARTNARTATFAFGAAKPSVTFECRLDGAGWAACASPATYSGIGDGTHAFSVRARDRYGIVDPAPPVRSWTVDTAAPDTSAIAILPSAVQPTATVAFIANDSTARFECSTDGGAWRPCASPLTVPGAHQLSVRAVDPAGNTDPAPPVVAIPAPPTPAASAVALTGPTAAIPVWSAGTDSPQCNLDGGQWTPCGPTLQTGALTPGPHALAVRAALPGGAVQTVTTTWVVALPAPLLVGVQFPVLVYLPPARKITKTFPHSRLPAVRFSLNVAATVQLSLDRTTGRKKGRHVATWTIAATAGANVSRVPLAIYRKLGDARYRLTANAAGAAGQSPVRKVRFQVVRKKR